MKRLFGLVILFFLAVGFVVLRSSPPVPEDVEPSGEAESSDSLQSAVWVATAYGIDYPASPTTSTKQLKQQCRDCLDTIQSAGFDTVYLQVRPSCDALYSSSLFPWSSYLTGTCGQAPSGGFDPLAYWVKQAHKRALRLEAWVNPYRVCAGAEAESDWSALPDDSPAKQHPEWVVKYDGGYYFDPGIPEVRQLVTDGVREIVENYDVDGVQFDDYFYPGTDFADDASYQAYGDGQSLEDWRRDNINQLIESVYETVHSYAKADHCVFGVSPSGIWKNGYGGESGSETRGFSHYSECYADSLAWVEHGWVDYLCPQIYWEIGNEAADFETLVSWWSDRLRGTDTRLIIGLAGYKIGDPENGSVWENDGVEEISRQLALCRNTGGLSGVALFSCQTIQNNDALFRLWNSQFTTKE